MVGTGPGMSEVANCYRHKKNQDSHNDRLSLPPRSSVLSNIDTRLPVTTLLVPGTRPEGGRGRVFDLSPTGPVGVRCPRLRLVPSIDDRETSTGGSCRTGVTGVNDGAGVESQSDSARCRALVRGLTSRPRYDINNVRLTSSN